MWGLDDLRVAHRERVDLLHSVPELVVEPAEGGGRRTATADARHGTAHNSTLWTISSGRRRRWKVGKKAWGARNRGEREVN